MFYLFVYINMNNINTVERAAYAPKKSNKWRNLWYGVMLLSLLNFSSPANAQNTSSNGTNTNNTETSTNNANSKESQKKYNMPDVYLNNLNTFLKNDFPIIKVDSTSTWMYTIDFALKEMESNRWISEDNQRLFIWHVIHRKVTGKDLYDRKDGNSERFQEFSEVLDKVDECSQRYEEWFMPFLEAQSAEFHRQSAQNKQQIAQNKQQIAQNEQQIAYNKQTSAEAINSSLENLARFYNRYQKDKSSISEEEVKQRKELWKQIVWRCKEENINYKTKLSKEMLKFYGVE